LRTGEIRFAGEIACGGEIPLKRGDGRISFHRARSERFHLRATPEDFTAAQAAISLLLLPLLCEYGIIA